MQGHPPPTPAAAAAAAASTSALPLPAGFMAPIVQRPIVLQDELLLLSRPSPILRGETEYLAWKHMSRKELRLPLIRDSPDRTLQELVRQGVLRGIPRGMVQSIRRSVWGRTTVYRLHCDPADVHIVPGGGSERAGGRKRGRRGAAGGAPQRRPHKPPFVWVFGSELRGVPHANITPHWFSFSVHPLTQGIAEWENLSVSSWVMYHGTSRTAAAAIRRSGFRIPRAFHKSSTLPSATSSELQKRDARFPHGMMGPAVYFASYDKALRFAEMDAVYQPRKEGGTVLRCVLQVRRALRFPACTVCSCCGERGKDHTGVWRQRADVCIVTPSANSTQRVEWAVADPADVCVLDSVLIQPAAPPSPPPAPAAVDSGAYTSILGMETFTLSTGVGGEATTASPPLILSSPAGNEARSGAVPDSPPFIITSPVYNDGAADSPPYVPTSP